MKIRLWTLAAALSLASALPLAAQRAMIATGMTAAQVRDAFGDPARTRTEGDWTYWFYSNGCPNRCGSDDVVFFQADHVVAAVLRTARRSISGAPAAVALERAGGDIDADAIRASAGEAAPPPRRRDSSRPIIVRGRSRDRNGEAAADEAAGDDGARVGRIHVESNGRVIDRTTTPSSQGEVRDAPGTTIIRTGGEQGGGQPEPPAGAMRRGDANGATPTTPGVITAGAQPAAGPLGRDSTSSAATTVDDKRYQRESEVRRTTVPNQPDTIQAQRRDREGSVTPRVVPKP